MADNFNTVRTVSFEKFSLYNTVSVSRFVGDNFVILHGGKIGRFHDGTLWNNDGTFYGTFALVINKKSLLFQERQGGRKDIEETMTDYGGNVEFEINAGHEFQSEHGTDSEFTYEKIKREPGDYGFGWKWVNRPI